MIRLLVATRSAHKLREIREILPPLPGIELVDLTAAGLAPSPEEDAVEAFDSFAENALAKAGYFAARSGLPVLADDSGLCVDALGGAPGVRSKRFAGRADLSGAALDQANNQLLLDRLRGVPPEQRSAHYQCAVALVDAGGREVVREGWCHGRILEAPRGSGGFGYDPLFYVPELAATFAEVDATEKNRVSHRAAAVRAAGDLLARGWLSSPLPDGPASR